MLSAKKRFNNFRIDTACIIIIFFYFLFRERFIRAPQSNGSPFRFLHRNPARYCDLSCPSLARRTERGPPITRSYLRRALSKGDENFGAIVSLIILIALFRVNSYQH